MKHTITFILSFLTLIFVATCSSCRTVQKSSTTTDSLVISKLERTRDSATEAELKKLIERLREDFVFTYRETTVVEDTSGSVRKNVRENILQHSRESSTDSLSHVIVSSTHSQLSDSTSSAKKEITEDVDKVSNNHRTVIIGMIIIFIVLLISNNRVKFSSF